MTLTFLKKIKNVMMAACGKLDTMEAEIHKQQTIITNLQTQVETIKDNQTDSTVLLEEILFAVSQSKDEQNQRSVPEEKPLIKKSVQIPWKLELN